MKQHKRSKTVLRIFFAAVCIFAAAVISGCWDDSEINGRAFVLGLGIDRSRDGGYCNFTFQLAIPVSGESSSSGSIGYSAVSVTDLSLDGAVGRLERDLGRQMNFEQLSIILIGDDLSRDSFVGQTGYFFRRASVRRQSCFAVCSGKAGDFLSLPFKGSPVSTRAAVTLQSFDDSGSITPASMNLHSLYRILSNRDEFYLLRLSSSGSGDITIAGAAAYGRDGNYLGELSEYDLELLSLTSGSRNGGTISFSDPISGEKYCCRVRQSVVSTECDVADGKPRFTLRLEMTLLPPDSDEISPGAALTEDYALHIALCAESSVRARLEELSERSRRTLGASVMGFQDILRQSAPEWYELHQSDWEKIYASSAVSVTVCCRIDGGGIIR